LNKIILKNLGFKAFRSYVDYTEVDELPENGLIQIRGKSGAGKTALHTVLGYLWGYAPYPDTEIQSYLTKDKLQAKLSFSYNDKDFILNRGKDEFSFNGVTGSVKLVQSEIQKFLKIPVELLEPLTVRHQRERSLFLSMTDSKKKEFLSKLLGLEQIEETVKNSSKYSNLLELELIGFKIKIDSIKSVLVEPIRPIFDDSQNSITRELSVLENQVISINDRLIDFQSSIDGYLENFKLFNSEMDKIKVNKREELLKDKPVSGFSVIKSEIKDKIKELDIEISKLSKGPSKNSLLAQLKSLEIGDCPTCLRPWESHDTYSQTILLQLKEIDENDKKREHLKREKDLLTQRLESALEEETNFNLDFYRKIDKTINELYNPQIKIKQQSIAEKVNAILESKKILQAEYNDKNSKCNTIKRTLDLEFQKRKLLMEQYDSALSNYNRFLDNLNEIQLKHDELDKKFKEEQDLVSFCKGFLGLIFEESLDEISTEANETLKQIQNVSSVTVRFDTEKINKNDTVRQEIKLVIHKNGYELPSFRTLSGGQQEAVELAVDLALGNVISRRTGIFPGWLVLDEPFSGLGPEEKESCLDMLKIASRDRLIFIIDHSTESKEYFDYAIEVTNENERSKLCKSKLRI
jgi:DNA repair exonuclease SbcCD ATPase subunit